MTTNTPATGCGAPLSARAVAVLDALIARVPSSYPDLAVRLRCSTLDIHNALWELHCAGRIDFQLGRRGQMTNITLRQRSATPTDTDPQPPKGSHA